MRSALMTTLIALCAVSFGPRGQGAENEKRDVTAAKEAALKWLAQNQEADGHWDAKKLGAKMNADAGCTGLALLAFLEAGHDTERGPYKEAVERAAKWIISKQDEDGCIGKGYEWPQSEGVGCTHALCGQALAQLGGMTGKETFARPAQKAVDYSLKHQTKYSGWGGAANSEPDLTTTTWFVMHLKNAKIAGLKVDGAGFQGAMAFLDSVTGKDGRAGTRKGAESTPVMTAAGMICRNFMGASNTDPTLQKASKYLLANLPNWDKAAGEDAGGAATDASFIYWYWGTWSAFWQGGDTWMQWVPIKKMLAGRQNQDGSWEPRSKLDAACGKVYTTALGTLTLQVTAIQLPFLPR